MPNRLPLRMGERKRVAKRALYAYFDEKHAVRENTTLTVCLHLDHCVLRVGLPAAFGGTWSLLDTGAGGLRLGSGCLGGGGRGHD